MERDAALLLLQYIVHPDAPIERIKLPTELILRQSCQAPRS
jgi:DNA-binding LacI/PurR family transcriptional regulator